jgi:hypothetical protein
MDVTTNNDNQYRGFVDDDQNYANFFATKWIAKASNSVFGTNLSAQTKKEKDKRADESKSQIASTWAIDPKRAKDCDYLNTRLSQLTNTLIQEQGKNPTKTAMDRIINPLKNAQTMYQNAIAENGCEAKKLEADRIAEEKRTLQGLQAAAQIGGGDTTNAPSSTSKNTKYVMYGVGGLLLLIVGVSILRR